MRNDTRNEELKMNKLLRVASGIAIILLVVTIGLIGTNIRLNKQINEMTAQIEQLEQKTETSHIACAGITKSISDIISNASLNIAE